MARTPLDSDFLDDNEFEEKEQKGFRDEKEERWDPPEPQEVVLPKGKDSGEKVTVEIGDDDVPEQDRGKWVADDERDGEPDIPSEQEVRGYAKDVQKRIGSMTARIHAERRRADQITRENQEAVSLARRLMQENNALKDFVQNGEKVLMGEHRGRLQSLLEQAKASYKEAHDAGDANGMVAAQEQIASAIAKMERASAQRPLNLPKEDESIFDQRAAPQQQQPDPDAVKWADKNKWFGRDDAMTGYALGYHKQLVEREGIMPDQPEYYSKLNQEMRRRFPDRFGSGRNGSGNGQSNGPSNGRELPERRSSSVVAGVNRTGSAAPRTVRITEGQAQLARRLGLTVEQYAQQLVAEQDRKDGKFFTHT